jgi:hypothetical protein
VTQIKRHLKYSLTISSLESPKRVYLTRFHLHAIICTLCIGFSKSFYDSGPAYWIHSVDCGPRCLDERGTGTRAGSRARCFLISCSVCMQGKLWGMHDEGRSKGVWPARSDEGWWDYVLAWCVGLSCAMSCRNMSSLILGWGPASDGGVPDICISIQWYAGKKP